MEYEMTRRSALHRGIVVSGGGLLAGCLGGSKVAETNEIDITSDGFDPANTEVEVGTRMLFKNRSDEQVHLKSLKDNLEVEKKLNASSATTDGLNGSGIYLIGLVGDSEAANSARSKLKIGAGTEIETPLTPSK
jgi:osmotically-inducible protein OsmY